jgi:hypothetical protein
MTQHAATIETPPVYLASEGLNDRAQSAVGEIAIAPDRNEHIKEFNLVVPGGAQSIEIDLDTGPDLRGM